ncbi:MAG: hypothetical protein IKL09_02065 [Clostridia bacterium]|nr:hypothetical protein [Clostridia bacterium]
MLVQDLIGYGVEMGYNENGVVIGNEAEGSRMEPESEDGILGMDLLRLDLERATTAKEAITAITDLLVKCGQKAKQLFRDENQDASKALLRSVTQECTEILYDFAKTEAK